MGIVKDAIGGLFGSGKDAAEDAADLQFQYGQQAIDFAGESRDLARSDLQPFRNAGASTLASLSPRLLNYTPPKVPGAPGAQTAPSPTAPVRFGDKGVGVKALIDDPTRQAAFIQDNPFYASLAKDATDRLMSNQAAVGKVGSGGTAAALQDRLLMLGNDLLSQNIQQRFQLADAQMQSRGQEFGQQLQSTMAQSGFDDQAYQQSLQGISLRDDLANRNTSQLMNLATIGANAAAGQATATQQAAGTISDLYTQQGNALAAGQIGGFQAGRNALSDLALFAGGV